MWNIKQFADAKKLVKELIDGVGGSNGYRGHADSSWEFKPTIDRAVPAAWGYADRLAEELSIVNKFKERAKKFLGTRENDFLETRGGVTTNALSVLQHYGAPTRLLDWSTSPFVALYFAVIHEPNKDAAVCWFQRDLLVSAAHSRWESYGCGAEPDGTRNLNAHAFKIDSTPWLCWTEYFRPFDRMQRQHGFFTIAGRLGIDHSEKLRELLPTAPNMWIIPAKLKPEIIELLFAMNITSASIGYEGADHVGNTLMHEMKLLRQAATHR